MDAGLNIKDIEGLGTGFRRYMLVLLRLHSESQIASGDTEYFDYE